MAAPGLPGMSSPEDLQAAGDYDEAVPIGTEGPGMEPEAAVPLAAVVIELGQDGSFTVIDAMSGEPVQAASIDEALGLAGELLQSNAMAGTQAANQAQRMEQPGMQDAQAIWDELAAQRPQRGNTM